MLIEQASSPRISIFFFCFASSVLLSLSASFSSEGVRYLLSMGLLGFFLSSAASASFLGPSFDNNSGPWPHRKSAWCLACGGVSTALLMKSMRSFALGTLTPAGGSAVSALLSRELRALLSAKIYRLAWLISFVSSRATTTTPSPEDRL